MEHKGINLEEVKRNNRAAILMELNRNGAMSRKNIAEAIGLTQAGVSIIVSEMLEEGILLELGELKEEEKRAGRKKILVDINAFYRYVLCVGIESETTYVSIVNVVGEVQASAEIATDRSMPAEGFLKMICDRFKEMLWDCGLSKDKVLSVGVSLPGEVDVKKGISIKAYHVWDYPVEVRSIFERELGIETHVENNVRAYAVTEILFGSGKNGGDIFLLKWGPGVGSAIIIDNKLYTGADGKAGEIGHIIAKKDGKLCSCGSRGCLETEVSSHAMREALGDENLINDKINSFALAIRNAIRYINPNRIVMVGCLFDNEAYKTKFIEAYKTYDPHVNDDFFTTSELAAKKNHTEALAVVLNSRFHR
ncbi:MAG: ROK family transcriptional regulator [Pseudobutyrivibrio sp.]|nr:ROK family transcriptional regulator [Pseudobutyrivibrio sp.]